MEEHYECIVDYALNLADNGPKEHRSVIRDTLRSFLKGSMSFEDAARRMLTTMGTTAVLEKVRTIKDIADAPPDDTQEDVGTAKKWRSWSLYEDLKLLAAIYKFGLEDWNSVSAFVGHSRTRAQCSQRWFRGLDPKLSKDNWTDEEVTKLMDLTSIHGEKNWTLVASLLGSRSDVQCRYKYFQMLKKFGRRSQASLFRTFDPDSTAFNNDWGRAFKKLGLTIRLPDLDTDVFDAT